MVKYTEKDLLNKIQGGENYDRSNDIWGGNGRIETNGD